MNLSKRNTLGEHIRPRQYRSNTSFAIKAQNIQLYMKFVCKFFLDFPIPAGQANPNH